MKVPSTTGRGRTLSIRERPGQAPTLSDSSTGAGPNSCRWPVVPAGRAKWLIPEWGFQCPLPGAELCWWREHQRGRQPTAAPSAAHLVQKAARWPSAWVESCLSHREMALPLMASVVRWVTSAISFWNRHQTLCVHSCRSVQTVIKMLMKENQQPFIITEEQLLTAFISGGLHGEAWQTSPSSPRWCVGAAVMLK